MMVISEITTRIYSGSHWTLEEFCVAYFSYWFEYRPGFEVERHQGVNWQGEFGWEDGSYREAEMIPSLVWRLEEAHLEWMPEFETRLRAMHQHRHEHRERLSIPHPYVNPQEEW